MKNKKYPNEIKVFLVINALTKLLKEIKCIVLYLFLVLTTVVHLLFFSKSMRRSLAIILVSMPIFTLVDLFESIQFIIDSTAIYYT